MIPTPTEFQRALSSRPDKDELAHVLNVISRAMRAGRQSTTLKSPDKDVIAAVQKELCDKGYVCDIEDQTPFCMFKWVAK